MTDQEELEATCFALQVCCGSCLILTNCMHTSMFLHGSHLGHFEGDRLICMTGQEDREATCFALQVCCAQSVWPMPQIQQSAGEIPTFMTA